MAKYNTDIVIKICDLIQSDTYTIPEICEQVGISITTFHDWKSKKADFSDSIKKAKDLQLINLARIARNSMVKKLSGYDYTETKTVNRANGDIEKTTITKHISPSDTMIIFTLKNTDSENFKDKHETDIKGKMTVDVDPFLQIRTNAELDKIIENLQAENEINN